MKHYIGKIDKDTDEETVRSEFDKLDFDINYNPKRNTFFFDGTLENCQTITGIEWVEYCEEEIIRYTCDKGP